MDTPYFMSKSCYNETYLNEIFLYNSLSQSEFDILSFKGARITKWYNIYFISVIYSSHHYIGLYQISIFALNLFMIQSLVITLHSHNLNLQII